MTGHNHRPLGAIFEFFACERRSTRVESHSAASSQLPPIEQSSPSVTARAYSRADTSTPPPTNGVMT